MIATLLQTYVLQGDQNWQRGSVLVAKIGSARLTLAAKVIRWSNFGISSAIICLAGLILGGDRFWQNRADLPLQFVGSGHLVSMSNSCQGEYQCVVTLQVFYNKTCCITAYIQSV